MQKRIVVANAPPPGGHYSQHFVEPLPVRTTVGSVLKGILVEIDVIAYRPAQ